MFIDHSKCLYNKLIICLNCIQRTLFGYASFCFSLNCNVAYCKTDASNPTNARVRPTRPPPIRWNSNELTAAHWAIGNRQSLTFDLNRAWRDFACQADLQFLSCDQLKSPLRHHRLLVVKSTIPIITQSICNTPSMYFQLFNLLRLIKFNYVSRHCITFSVAVWCDSALFYCAPPHTLRASLIGSKVRSVDRFDHFSFSSPSKIRSPLRPSHGRTRLTSKTPSN